MTAPCWWAAGFRGTYWPPIAAAPLVAIASLLTADLTGVIEIAGVYSRGLVAVSVAFVIDDCTARVAPALPLTSRTRLLARASCVLPFSAAGLCAVTLVEWVVTGAVLPYASPSVALAAASVALAAAVSEMDVPSPGAIGAAGAAAVTVAGMVAPAVREGLPDRSAIAVVLVAGREPDSVGRHIGAESLTMQSRKVGLPDR